METADSTPENKRYNAEAIFLDGFYDFHPKFFNGLNDEEWVTIETYYLTGKEDIPENVFEYRLQLIKDNPELEQKAQQAFRRILDIAGIKDFHY